MMKVLLTVSISITVATVLLILILSSIQGPSIPQLKKTNCIILRLICRRCIYIYIFFQAELQYVEHHL